MISHADHPKVRYLIIRMNILNSPIIEQAEESQPAEEPQPAETPIYIDLSSDATISSSAFASPDAAARRMSPLGHSTGPKSPILVPERHSVPMSPTRIQDPRVADLPPETIEETAANIHLDSDAVDKIKSFITDQIRGFYKLPFHNHGPYDG